MAENSSHAPGMGSDFGGERQRHMMGEGKGPMSGGDFGIGATPGTRKIAGRPASGSVLSDSERSAGPAIGMGRGKMAATAHSDHGEHRHFRSYADMD
jgi:hypothetical protein